MGSLLLGSWDDTDPRMGKGQNEGGFSEEKLQMYKDCFKLMDINKDGQLDKNDLRGAFDNVGVLVSESELDGLLGEISGPCTYDNMVKMFQEKMAGEGNDPDDLIVQAFKAYDNEGKIDSKMFEHALKTWGDKMTKAEIDDIFESNLYQVLVKRSNLVVGDHVVEGVVEFVRTLLDLQLLTVDLVLDVADPLVELGDVHLAVLKPGLSHLVLALQVVDLLNQLLLPLQSLLSGGLKLLHVLADSLKLLLDVLQVLLSELSPLDGPLQLSFLHSQLPAQLVQLLLVVRGHLDGGPQVLVQLLNGHLVVQAGVLNDLDGLHHVVLLLHEHDPPGEGGDVALHLLELLLSLLEGLGGLGQLVVGLVKTNLKPLDFLTVVTDVAVGLVSPGGSLPGGLLETSNGVVETICLALERLHLLPNGIHVSGFSFSSFKKWARCLSWRVTWPDSH